MRRRLLIITKEPEFDTRNEVVLGQCEPFTSGWRLILIDRQGKHEQLMAGNYTDLRKVQESCSEIEETPKIRKRVEDLRVLLTASVTETIAVRPNGSEPNDATKELTPLTDFPRATPGGLLKLEPSNGVVIATVAQPERAADAGYLKHELLTILECRPKAVLMDLTQVVDLSAGSLEELAGVRERLRDAGANFALCNVSGGVQQKLKNSEQNLPIYENQALALAALKA
jgi:anti-anti-sigma regulatory factor